jgi:hypothetical protein
MTRSSPLIRKVAAETKPAVQSVCLCLIFLGLSAGCSPRSDQPPLGLVHGTVTLNGKPLKGATVSFHPVDGGRQSYDHTDDQGSYDVVYLRDIRGAKIGKHRVTIRTAGVEAPEKETVPARYNSKTTLEVEVKSDQNHFDFALTSP